MKPRWDEVSALVGSRGLMILDKVWHNHSQITEEDKEHLRPAFERYPLGTGDFRVWLKQRTRQLFEKEVRESLNAHN